MANKSALSLSQDSINKTIPISYRVLTILNSSDRKPVWHLNEGREITREPSFANRVCNLDAYMNLPTEK